MRAKISKSELFHPHSKRLNVKNFKGTTTKHPEVEDSNGMHKVNWPCTLHLRCCSKSPNTCYQISASSLQEHLRKIFVTKPSVWATVQVKHVLPHLTCSAEEADMRIWLHCTHSIGTKKLVFSPDTDVFHIGMLFLRHTRLSECEIIV